MSDLKIAAVYIRVSTDEQTELSPESQLETIREYAAKNGYLIPDDYVFVDPGISGRSARNRPHFNRMISMAKQQDHPFDVILLWKFSRFARNQEESIVYKAMLRKSGVEVVSISEPIIDGPFGSLIERIIEWMDEYYSIRLSGEVKRSMTVNAQRGVRQTAPPFGYMAGPKDGPFMVPQPEEADVIREVFRRYAAGDTVWDILRDLNARNIRTHRGSGIENRTIMYWLQNPTYVGKNRWTPTGRTRRDFHNPDSVVIAGDHEALVSEDLFNAVQERVRRASDQRRPKQRPSFELKDWMGGVVRCADCGSTLVFQAPRYFVCNGYVRGRCVSRQSITVDALHDAVIGRLRADLNPSVPLHYTLAESAPVGSALRALELQRSLLARKLQRVREAYMSGVDSLEEYRQFKASIDSEILEIDSQLSELTQRQDPAAASAALRISIQEVLSVLESPDLPKEQKNAAIKQIVDTCTWSKESSTLAITYRVFV